MNREIDLFEALRGVPPMTDPSGRESVAKHVGPYGWRRESVAKHVGPYGWRRESVAKYVGPYGWRRQGRADQTGVLTAHPESAPEGPFES